MIENSILCFYTNLYVAPTDHAFSCYFYVIFCCFLYSFTSYWLWK